MVEIPIAHPHQVFLSTPCTFEHEPLAIGCELK